MGKIQDLYYLLTRGKNAPKPFEHGPAVALKAKCGCGGNCGCDSIESLEKSAGLKKTTIKIVPATTDDKPSTIPTDLKAHLEAEGVKPKATRQKKEPVVKSEVAPIIAGINKKASEVKKPVAKTTAKKEAIKKDIADEPVAKKPAPKKK